MKDNMPARRLIRGSRRIAEYLGDATLNQHLRARPQDFGLFHVGGLLCAYADEIDIIMAAKRAAGAVTPASIQRNKDDARNRNQKRREKKHAAGEETRGAAL